MTHQPPVYISYKECVIIALSDLSLFNKYQFLHKQATKMENKNKALKEEHRKKTNGKLF